MKSELTDESPFLECFFILFRLGKWSHAQARSDYNIIKKYIEEWISDYTSDLQVFFAERLLNVSSQCIF